METFTKAGKYRNQPKGDVLQNQVSGGTQSSSIFGQVLYARPASLPATNGPLSRVRRTTDLSSTHSSTLEWSYGEHLTEATLGHPRA